MVVDEMPKCDPKNSEILDVKVTDDQPVSF